MTSRISLAVFCFAFATAAIAQEEETQQVDMQVGMPGMPAQMNMNVKVKTKTTRSAEVGPAPSSAPIMAPAMAPVARLDCGTGDDAGCSMRRNGHSPMDGESFRGFLDSMRSNPNEISRNEIAEETLKTEYLTAKQLGLVLDLFNNEITRFDVAKDAAPHVVNPKHAMGLSSKFNNSIYATDFTKLMVSQR